VFSHTPPTAAYRGAGRPEASYAIERVIDTAARELGVDPADLRRRNTIPRITTPFQTGLVFLYDSGDFLDNLEKALAQADYKGYAARRSESKARGRLRGFEEAAELHFDADGSATLIVGTHSHGQGHETVFRQLLTDSLGMSFDKIRFVQGDTDLVAQGSGTFGSRSSGLGGAAVQGVANKIIDKARKIAAHRFESAEEDVEFEAGTFRITGTDRTMSLAEVARAAADPAQLPSGMEPGLSDKMVYAPKAATYPNGCHCCEIEIDPDTGHVEILRYLVIDDVGTVMNPMLLKGQIHGGIVQGVGQILGEQIVWDAETGQPLTGSFMDYAMPRADLVPSFEVESNPVPTPMNPLGIKGAGEAGTVGAMPCLVNAIVDALSPIGITTIDMPATPQRIWQTIKDAPKKL
jgi:carbon-monoxide dehydrogenase large subunit